MTEATSSATVPGPREVFTQMQERWLSNGASPLGDDLAEDVVIESPFAPPGRPQRIEGRAACIAFTEAGRASLPARFEECRNVVIHETADAEVIVVEYELAGMVTTTNQPAAAAFIGVLRVRDGQIVHWREYQNVLAIAQALGQLPALLAGINTSHPKSAPAPTAGLISLP
jgi:uncharacterized protein